MKFPARSRLGTLAVAGPVIILLALLCYWGVGDNAFLNYDDPQYIVENSHLSGGFSAKSLLWAFTSTDCGNWHPLTWLSHMADCHLFGLNPAAHHRVGLAFHIMNSVLLFAVLRSMTGTPLCSLFAAVLFAVHPLHVESVAWASERKDLLSGFFFFVTLAGYKRCVTLKDSDGSWFLWYVITFLSFGAGLMSKSMLVTSPCVLLLLDVWPLRRFNPAGMDETDPVSPKAGGTRSYSLVTLALEKIPFFVLSCAFCVVTLYAQSRGGAVSELDSIPLLARIANAAVSYVTYATKALVPHSLCIFYPHPKTDLSILSALVAGSLLLGGSTLAFLSIRSRPYFFTGWFWFVGMLVPVSGIVQVGSQAMADRYMYLPYAGLAVIMAWALRDLYRHSASLRRQRRLLFAGIGAVISALVLVTRLQVATWRDSETVFRHCLALGKESFVACNNLGLVLMDRGRYSEAEQLFRTATELAPGRAKGHNNLGSVYMKTGRRDLARKSLVTSLRLDPQHAAASANMGHVSALDGDYAAAERYYRAAIEAGRGTDPHLLNSLAWAVLREGDPGEAESLFGQVLELSPGFFPSLIGRAEACSVLGDTSRAGFLYESVGSSAAGNLPMLKALGESCLRAGRHSLARQYLQQALQIARDRRLETWTEELSRLLSESGCKTGDAED